MYRIYRTAKFEKSYKRLIRSGAFKKLAKTSLTTAIGIIARGATLPQKYKDHALIGNFFGYRECHIRGDLLLLYQRDTEERTLDLVDIGSHSQLFG